MILKFKLKLKFRESFFYKTDHRPASSQREREKRVLRYFSRIDCLFVVVCGSLLAQHLAGGVGTCWSRAEVVVNLVRTIGFRVVMVSSLIVLVVCLTSLVNVLLLEYE